MPGLEEIVAEKKDRFVEELKELLRVSSVSAEPGHAPDMARCAGLVEDHLRRLGFTTERLATGGHPMVLAERQEDPALPTVLIYGHYDVQPPDPLDLWEHGAFTPTLVGGDIVARGASDDKGQFFAHFKGIEVMLMAAKRLPVNVKVIIEGEEEVGSKSIARFLQESGQRMRCDVVVISDGGQYAPGIPAITYGLRGIVALEIKVQGPARDLHSGSYGGAVANPAVVLSHIIASLHTPEGKVAVRGFYDDVEELDAEERQLTAALPFDEAAYLRELDVPRSFGEPGYTILERTGARPTLEVNGIFGGYSGEGSKTIIPAFAGAKITCRLVPRQDPRHVYEAVVSHLKRAAPDTIRLKISGLEHGAPAVLFARRGPAMQAAARALARGFGREPVWIREGGSIPLVETMVRTLGAPILLVGYGQQDDRAHSPNEKFAVADFTGGILTSAYLLKELASLPRA